AMRRLRDRIEANLSGRLGPSTAQEIVSRLLPYKESPYAYDIEDINFIENRLESYRKDLRGLAAELDTLRRYHRQTLRDLPIGVLSIGVDGEVLLWNRAMEALTQTPAGEVIGSTLASLAPPWGALFADFLHDPAMQRHKEPIKLGGEQRWVALHKSDVSAEDVYQGGSQVILVEDMTDTRLLEQKLMHSERLASIGRLAAGVAHEIGNPVTGIDCLAQNLAAESDEAEIRELAEQIRQQIRRINRIVQSLVTFAHRGNPETPSRHGAVSLRACVAEAVELLSIGGKGYDIRFDNRCDPDLDVRGDSQRLQQVFVNLLDNARDASPPGACILIRSQLLEGMVQTEVIDQGSGIDKSLHERVFDPFFTTKEPGEGTGLGLALAYSIVEAHQGQLLIDSPLDAATGRGTKVTVLLPKWVESTQQSAQTDDSESETG
ncbi:MAG TPA: ATP-binding protein, partial [Pseudomonadales bacterium]|nr:ATP-binding protein [Pseudomonadales bacterium]